MLSSGFNYNEVKERSSGVTTIKRFEKPVHKSSFLPNETIKVKLNRVPQSFADLKNSYLKFKIVSSNSTRSYFYRQY